MVQWMMWQSLLCCNESFFIQLKVLIYLWLIKLIVTNRSSVTGNILKTVITCSIKVWYFWATIEKPMIVFSHIANKLFEFTVGLYSCRPASKQSNIMQINVREARITCLINHLRRTIAFLSYCNVLGNSLLWKFKLFNFKLFTLFRPWQFIYLSWCARYSVLLFHWIKC